jgi:hypothetical protein
MSFSESEAYWLTIEDIQQTGGAVESETNTEELEYKLNSILRTGHQIGAGRKSSKKGSKDLTGGKRRKSSKKGSKDLTGGKRRKGSKKGSKDLTGGKRRKGSKKGSKDLEGGMKRANVKETTMKKGSKKGSKVSTGGKKKKGSKKGSKQSRALPEALLLFQELVKHVAAGIGKGGRPAMTIAGQVKKDVVAKDSSLTGKEMINAAKKHFDEHKDKYMKMV